MMFRISTKRLRDFPARSLVLVGLALVLSVGCTANPLGQITAPATLTIRNVESQGQVGTYLLSGEAAGLNGATISVAAVRQLNDRQATNYAILDRQFVSAEKGRWQAKLQLWQQDATLSPQEAWQVDEAAFDLALSPSPEVTFLVSLDPTALQERQPAIAPDAEAAIQYTPDGERYLVAQSTITIPVPSSNGSEGSAAARRTLARQTTPVTVRAQADVSPATTTSRIEAPLSPDQYLQ